MTHRAVSLFTALALFVTACGEDDSSGNADGGDPALTLLAIADFEWVAQPAVGFTTPFSFEIITPAVDGRVDVSYWMDVQDDDATGIGTTPRYDYAADSEFDHRRSPLSMHSPCPTASKAAIR